MQNKRTVIVAASVLLIGAIGGFGALWCQDGAEGEGGLRIVIDAPLKAWRVGEPIPLFFHWHNTSDRAYTIAYSDGVLAPLLDLHVQGPVREECKGDPGLGKWAVGGVPIEGGSNSRRSSVSMSMLGIVDPGTYRIWYEYDSTSLVAEQWISLDVFRGRLRSNELEVTIKHPTTEDIAVLEEWANECNGLEFSRRTTVGSSILSDYRDSVYAGWVLLEGAAVFDELRHDVASLSLPSMSELSDDNQQIYEFMREEASKQIVDLSRYLNHNPEFVLADFVRYEIAYLRAYRRENDDAKSILQEVVKSGATSERVRQKGARLLNYLDDAGR